jgi:excisionase family DNA binding protein
VDLSTAAEQLSVHYQTAYRWVRSGALVGVKIGSVYEVSEEEVVRVKRLRSTPVQPPRTVLVRHWSRQVERLESLLVLGDEVGCRRLVERLANGGVATVDLCDLLLAPALSNITSQERRGTISVAVERRATSIAERLIARLTVHPMGRPRGPVVVIAPAGEANRIPTAMAAITLRADRWRVHDLGPGVPLPDTEALCQEVGAHLVVICVGERSQLENAECLQAKLEASGLSVLVARPGKTFRELVKAARAA